MLSVKVTAGKGITSGIVKSLRRRSRKERKPRQALRLMCRKKKPRMMVRGVMTKILITTKISDNGNDKVQQEVVLEELRSVAQERPRRVSKPPQRYGWDDENDEVHFALIATCRDKSKIDELKGILGGEFDMKDLGVAKKILRMEIKRDRKVGKLWLSRRSAKQCPSMDAEMEDMVKVPYANAVGCLIYAMVGSSPLEVCGDKGFSCQGGSVINTTLSNDFQGLKFLFDKVEIVDVCLKIEENERVEVAYRLYIKTTIFARHSVPKPSTSLTRYIPRLIPTCLDQLPDTSPWSCRRVAVALPVPPVAYRLYCFEEGCVLLGGWILAAVAGVGDESEVVLKVLIGHTQLCLLSNMIAAGFHLEFNLVNMWWSWLRQRDLATPCVDEMKIL
ncbi:hypothetical protein EZV62_004313 [Acer yangbiense]|uniref:Uncharacterized protein n=1 Tax=Acer yangbiense TaxID=1000413 RepID=A0A5C7IJN0_9ROSI|nr:hypothetical protein EZV62_004313 [Acer yangbiense]